MSNPRLALFDVDETLIQVKSMFSFLDLVLARQGWSEKDRHWAVNRFQRLASEGASREFVNETYYRGFAGQSRTWMVDQGREWFNEQFSNGTLFHKPVLRELFRLKSNNCVIALVSGSFDACLTPIAEYVGARYIFGTVPSISGDTYTGEIERPMIGIAKAEAAQDLIQYLKLDTRCVCAYGDHISDAPLLRIAGEGVVVGNSPEMLKLAAYEGWRHLPVVLG
ncbi:HAD family hydrolase [Corynebacterium freiburgense]|uniref:HAD family hydrolase n=1 Tax=Corynebacterium freiburgense TaxID=556548 RepID=UPI00054EF522|nr:HAD-IB family hydrolase [Corynebacterium freiburgense]WJZ02946.1 haloacid dehalogenase-like hydrolase [Corynebacterium freiburgense]